MNKNRPDRHRRSDHKEYPFGIPLQPPPGWAVPKPAAVKPPPLPISAPLHVSAPEPAADPLDFTAMREEPYRRGSHRYADTETSWLGPVVKVVAVLLILGVCGGIGWTVMQIQRRSESRPSAKKKSVESQPLAKASTPARDPEELPTAVADTEKQPPPATADIAPPASKPTQPTPDKEPPAPPAKPEPPPRKESASPSTITFQQHILPIMERSCTMCHRAGKARGGLDVTSLQAILRGGDDGPGVRPGKPDNSPLFTSIVEGRMPPSGKKLPDEEIKLLRDWIDSGAK